MRHVNIPVFIPHLGCPNQCVFCNQRKISGVESFDPDSVHSIIEKALSTVDMDDEVEIAFFGGSFTGIDRELMVSLLEIAHSYIKKGLVRCIRCSTRPDYIDEEILNILWKYGVRTIELGLQSSSDRVLEMSKRGHNFEAERNGCKLIVDHGFNLVGQMMIGLPGSDIESEMETARFIASCGAVGARIYPTVVFRETELCQMADFGLYTPLTVQEAVERSAAALKIFIDSGIEVIRIGLQSSDNLSDEKSYAYGPNHPSLGELVMGEVYYREICEKLSREELTGDENICVYVGKGQLSKAVGQHKRNKLRLKENYKNLFFAEAEGIKEYHVQLQINNGEIKCI